jgi:hypothetical protein
MLIAIQKICPVTGKLLGSMGHPLKVSIDNQEVFICCAGCKTPLEDKPEEYLPRIAPPPKDAVLSIPEQAVVDTGSQRVVYVEREPGTFEGVEVELGPRTGGFYPVISGLAAGDKIAAAGSFLLDAETRLNPAAASAYFGAGGSNGRGGSADNGGDVTASARGARKKSDTPSTAARKELEKLGPEDRVLAIAQGACPVTGEPLGSMGAPFKVLLEGHPVFLCCAGCETEAREHSERVLKEVKAVHAAAASESPMNSAPVHNH